MRGRWCLCTEGDEYEEPWNSYDDSDEYIEQEQVQDNIIDARQAIHPCISNAPMFYYLHYFSKVLLYMCYMLVASAMVKLGTYHHTKSHIHYPSIHLELSTQALP